MACEGKKKVKPILCFPQAIQILWKTLISWITVKFFTKCFLKTQFPSGKTKFNNSLVVQLMEHNPEKTDWLPSNARLNQNSLLADKRTAWVSLTGANPAAQVAAPMPHRSVLHWMCASMQQPYTEPLGPSLQRLYLVLLSKAQLKEGHFLLLLLLPACAGCKTTEINVGPETGASICPSSQVS